MGEIADRVQTLISVWKERKELEEVKESGVKKILFLLILFIFKIEEQKTIVYEEGIVTGGALSGRGSWNREHKWQTWSFL